jgi:putative transposase
MFDLVLDAFRWSIAFFRSRNSLGLEIIALRQQLGVLKRKNSQPRVGRLDRLFWVQLRQVWSRWSEVLVVVKPETVVRSHRAGFRLCWRFLSRRGQRGRPKVAPELHELIHRMAEENPTWGAPRIHGELLKLGFQVSERTVSRYLAQVGRRGDPAQRWMTFLKNRRDVIAAMDFFTVPTLTFRVLYCFFVIRHGRRVIPHFNVTQRPTSQWLVQQLRETFPDDNAPQYLILDRDAKFAEDVIDAVRAMRTKPIRTSYQSPWQNGFAERWVGSCRREMLDHVIVLNENHLRRLMRDYIRYYHEDRIHDALNKETPRGRLIERREIDDDTVTGMPRVGGLHHRYVWRAAA